MMTRPIDAVIPWVDGNDPVLTAKRRRYLTGEIDTQEDVAAATRYANIGEIYWCVCSINKFAPWIRKIYLITDGQDPGLEPLLRERFPDGYIPMQVIDHKDIFKGYEEYLPVFNSVAIETMFWRIPGLSEHYITFNDDFLIAAPVSPSDFFTENGLVCYADSESVPFTCLTRKLKYLIAKRKVVTFKGLMMNAAQLSKESLTFLKINHTPRGLHRSWFERVFSEHPELLLRNISHRFRDASQFSSEELQYLGFRKEGRLVVRPVRKHLFYYKYKDRKGYFEKKMAKLQGRNWHFVCFNSLDIAPQNQQDIVREWVVNLLDHA